MFMRLTSTGHSVIPLALVLTLHSGPLASFAFGHEPAAETLPDWAKIADTHQERLSHVDSDQKAREVFVDAVGRSAGLPDVAGTLAVQGMSTRMVKELMVPQITTSAQRLVSALVAWQLSDRMMQALEGKAVRMEVGPCLRFDTFPLDGGRLGWGCFARLCNVGHPHLCPYIGRGRRHKII